MSGSASEGMAELQVTLAAEHAAVYAYGVIGAHLDDYELTLAHQADLAHREARDAVADLVSEAGATPAPAAAAYRLPRPVTDRAAALGLAVEIETKVAAVWRAALAAVPGADRATALDALMRTAVRAAEWRAAADPSVSPTVPWPGR